MRELSHKLLEEAAAVYALLSHAFAVNECHGDAAFEALALRVDRHEGVGEDVLSAHGHLYVAVVALFVLATTNHLSEDKRAIHKSDHVRHVQQHIFVCHLDHLARAVGLLRRVWVKNPKSLLEQLVALITGVEFLH